MSAVSPALALDFAPPARRTAAVGEQILNFVLFVTMSLSSIAFIEPSPHDLMMFVLLTACIAARVPFDRKLVPLLLLIVLWLVGGGLSVMQVDDAIKPVQYFGTSVYLGLAAIVFACLFNEGNLGRLSILRRAYLLAAAVATIAGYLGFFHLIPHADLFLDNERLSATFKDPNVYGPFLIFPLLVLVIGFLTRGVTLVGLTTVIFLLGGLFLSFSRGAWIHFGVSAMIAVAILYVGSPDRRLRGRIVTLCFLGLVAIALLLAALLTIGSVHDMLIERAKAIQPYDVGSGGRFFLQQLALTAILDHPNGMGPYAFSLTYGGQQHNVYMQCFLVYGWLGGTTYLALVLITVMVGFRNVFAPTPWRYYLIAAYGAFVGDALEGVIIDTDHWRHFFLLLGLVWGLSVAAANWRQRLRFESRASAAAVPAASSVADRTLVSRTPNRLPEPRQRPVSSPPAALRQPADHGATGPAPAPDGIAGLMAALAAAFEKRD